MRFLEGDVDDVPALPVDDHLALDVDAGDVVPLDAELVVHLALHQAPVRERLRTQQAERPGHLLAPLVDAAGLQRAGDARLARHADQCHLRQAHLGALDERQRVGRVGVARARRGEDLFRRRDDGRLDVPGPLLGELRRGRAVDVPLLQAPDQEGRYHTAVLPRGQHTGVGRAAQDDVLVDPDQLILEPGPAEQRLVHLRFPVPEARTGPCADVAALVAVNAYAGPLRLQLERFVVLVAKDVEGTDHDARGTAGAETAGDDLFIEVTPLGLGVEGRAHARGRV